MVEPMLEATIRAGDLSGLRQALDAGASVEATAGPHQTSLLFLAIECRQPDLVRLLVSRGAKLERRGSSGHTALMVALLKSTDEIVQILLDAGASPRASSDRGQSVPEVAFLSHRFEWIERFRELGVPVKPTLDLAVRAAKLRLAAARGDLEQVKSLLAQGVDANGTPGDRPLCVATQQNHIEVVRWLLDHGADPRIPSEYEGRPFDLAAMEGNVEILRLLLARGVRRSKEDWENTLLGACHRGFRGVLELALEHGASPQASWWDEDVFRHQSAVELAAMHGHADLVKILQKHSPEKIRLTGTPLTLALRSAVHRGDRAMIEELHDQGASLRSALQHLVDANRPELVDFLVQRGADPDWVLERGMTALQRAEREGRTELARALRACGARRDMAFLGLTRAFFRCIYSQDLDKIRQLVREGADLNHPGDDGRLPLDAAEFYRRPRAAKLLEELGARRSSEPPPQPRCP